MVAKKSPEANLENKKSLFVLIGFVLVLSLVFIAFEWSKKDIKRWTGIDIEKAFVEDVFIPPTAEPTPPPPPPPPLVVEQFVLVDNQTDAKGVDINSEINPNEALPDIVQYVTQVVETEPDVPIWIAEVMPEFKGNIFEFLSKNVKYPVVAQELGVQGRVICQFVVNKDGSIDEVEVVRSIDTNLDKEAVRVIKSMPNWKPGKQNGKPVRVRFTLPVNFKLSNM
jgi:protein TonB